MKTLLGTLLQPASSTRCEITKDCHVRIGDDGRIASVGGEHAASDEIVGGAGCWILPGFIDAHLHVSQWDRRGIDGIPVMEWQEKIGYPAEIRLSSPAVVRALAEDFTRGVIANGTTTVAAFGSSFKEEVATTFGVFAEKGLRAIYGMALNDTDMPAELLQQSDQALDDARALAAQWHGSAQGRLLYAFSPRTSLRCSEKLMRGAAALANMFKCYLQTHIADSVDERNEFQNRYPDQIDEVEYLHQMGVLGPRTILAHGAFVDPHHRREIVQSSTSLVNCPTANLFRESGLVDYVVRNAAGIRMALGSSIGGGFDPFMPRVAVEGLQTAKALRVHSLPRRGGPTLSPSEAWWLLTTGGAAALSLGHLIGTIAQGYQADCLVVRPEKWIADLPPEQQVAALLYTISPQQIEHVFIAGRRVGPGVA
ncbi:MAG: amidohydrolase family protein [Phycisphaerae bacterium]